MLTDDTFLEEQQCRYLMRWAEPELSVDFRPVPTDGREGMLMPTDEDEPTACVRIRHTLAQISQQPLLHVEPVQVVRYQPGSTYPLHYDGFWRRWTFMVYLNDDFVGGELVFPLIDFTTRPKQGKAYYWQNADDKGNIKDHAHCGNPITEGVKWIAITFSSTRPFVRSEIGVSPKRVASRFD